MRTPDLIFATPVNPVCDFCYLGPVRWSYPARPFVLHLPGERPGPLAQGVDVESPDDWAACDPCHDLIEAGDRVDLAIRAAEAIPGDHPGVALEDLIAVYQNMHARFFEHREGVCQRREK